MSAHNWSNPTPFLDGFSCPLLFLRMAPRLTLRRPLELVLETVKEHSRKVKKDPGGDTRVAPNTGAKACIHSQDFHVLHSDHIRDPLLTAYQARYAEYISTLNFPR